MKEQVTSIVREVLNLPECRSDFLAKITVSSNSLMSFSREYLKSEEEVSSIGVDTRQLADVLIFKMISSSLNFISDTYSKSPFYKEFLSKIVLLAINSINWEEVIRDLLENNLQPKNKGTLGCSQEEDQ